MEMKISRGEKVTNEVMCYAYTTNTCDLKIVQNSLFRQLFNLVIKKPTVYGVLGSFQTPNASICSLQEIRNLHAGLCGPHNCMNYYLQSFFYYTSTFLGSLLGWELNEFILMNFSQLGISPPKITAFGIVNSVLSPYHPSPTLIPHHFKLISFSFHVDPLDFSV